MKFTLLLIPILFSQALTASEECKPVYLKITSIDRSVTTNQNGKYVSLKKLQQEGLISPVIIAQNARGVSFDHVSFLPGENLLLKGPKNYLRFLFFPVYRENDGEHSFKIYDAQKFKFENPIKVPFQWGGLGFETLSRKIILNRFNQEVLILSFKQRGNPQIHEVKINLETLSLEN